MTISLIHPSRSRPEKAKQTYDFWISQSSGLTEIEHILSLDFSDILNEDYDIFEKSRITIDHNESVVEATNQACKIAKGDILIYLSDDFLCPKHWDILILDKFIGVESPMLLKVDDCLQPFNIAVLTIPIMNLFLYQKLGYFWNPEYKSMFVDEHLYWITKNNNWLVDAPELKFKHDHHTVSNNNVNDETYQRSANNWHTGKATFEKHKKLNFPL